VSDIVRFQDVKKKYGQKEALKGLTFSVKKGELLALLGPNGAGKSTALNLLLGLKSHDSGLVEVFGKCPDSIEARHKIGSTLQELSFPSNMTIQELLHFTQSHYQKKGNLDSIVRNLQIENLLNRRAVGMSGGERRKVGLAMALSGDPELLILDEPTTGMDIESRRDLWRVIEILVKEGRTIILTTHYLEEVEALAHRVVVIDEGVALFDGTVSEIKAKVEMKKVKFCTKSKDENFNNFPEIINVARKSNEVTVLTHNSDTFVRDLILKNIDFHELSIEIASLEEAFLVIRGRL